MVDELVDVVNEEDEVIGQEWKNKCHEEGILHRISAVILFNSEGKMWLQIRAKGKVSAGKMDFSASGHVGAGDSYEKSAYRELKEEIGIKTNLKLIAKKLYEHINLEGLKIKHFISLYAGKCDGPFSLQEEEVDKIEAYNQEEIKELMKTNPNKMTTGLRLGLELYLKLKNDSK